MSDIGRLNVLLELFSECSGITDLETLLQTVSDRLHWAIDFEKCVFVVVQDTTRKCWIGDRTSERLRPPVVSELSEQQRVLVDRILETGAPANESTGAMCVPLQVAGQTLGAMFFSTAAHVYTHADMRIGHHTGQQIGALVSRLALEAETKRLSARKDDLLALLSHEIRNPLAPIISAVDLLRMRAGSGPTKELDIIARQAQHMVRLVDDLLDVARLTRGKVILVPRPVELALIIAVAVEMVSPLFEGRRHSLEIDVPMAGLIVEADANRLAQVMSNLLTNAAHYTGAGGHVTVTARREGTSAVIDVRDDGIGIAQEDLGHVFEQFVQGSQRESGPGGLGLGLVIVQQLVALHGGTVSVASDGPGHGATFTVRVPVLPLEFIEPARAVSSVPRARMPQRVLLVDDNSDACELLSDLLTRAGHAVTAATSATQALALLASCKPSVAVIDLGMPVMDGYELAALLRALPGGPSIRLIALTGYGQSGDRARTRDAGFDGHLVKPVAFAQLLQLLDDGTDPTVAVDGSGELRSLL